METCARVARARTVVILSVPALWPCWPFLPVTRRLAGGGVQLGVVADLRGLYGLTGYSATVFLCNLFRLPPTPGAFLALPREVYDWAEEVADAGWSVD